MLKENLTELADRREDFKKKNGSILHCRYFMYFIKFKHLLLNIKISNRVSSRLLSGFRSEYIVFISLTSVNQMQCSPYSVNLQLNWKVGQATDEKIDRRRVSGSKLHPTLFQMLFRGTYFVNLCSSEPETDILPLFIEKNQWDAAVITLRYTTLRHSGLWEVIHTSPFGTVWKNMCVWNSKSCQFNVDFMFSI